ncbi:Hha/YmoA family nucleoid-associated regulatory protein (plasmid) [Klebsiella sp. WOUb02]|uniref:Hha/YmoA family nucleoid-associated regulatory protein n=1 Tax=Klebsiella sp. WOUb02 TaxID=3161071 RepID=UPI003CF70222
MLKSPNAESSLREVYLLKFRKCSTTQTLDKVFERIQDKLSEEGRAINEIISLNGAYDHRRSEIYMKKIYDKIPTSVWRLMPDDI